MKIRNLALSTISLCLVLSLVLVSGCNFISTTEQNETTSTITTTQTVGQSSSTISVTVSPTATPGITLPSIADVVAKVKPSVVAINVKTVVTVYDFFGRAYQQEQEGAGSGWIISSDGLIVTNNHVVEGATSIMITLNDGTSLPADMANIKADEFTDLAVLKVDANGLPAVAIGDSSKLREGEWVVAIGNSLGEGIRVTQGIVSRKDVAMQDENGQTLPGLIETDAVINPGNSGGPLVNMSGQVIGITNAKRVQTGVEGVGYAISSNEAAPIIQDLINNGYIVRPYLGVNTETIVNSSYARWYGLRVNSGVRVTSVSAESPAGIAGFQINDVIVKFDGQDITQAQQLIDAIHHSEVGKTVEVVYWRGTEQHTLTIVLTESPKPQ